MQWIIFIIKITIIITIGLLIIKYITPQYKFNILLLTGYYAGSIKKPNEKYIYKKPWE